MKSQLNQKLTETLGELRAGLLAAVAEMDLRGTDLKVTQAMCIIETAFSSAVNGRKVVPRQTFLSGMAKAKSAESFAAAPPVARPLGKSRLASGRRVRIGI